ncbi:MAG: Holliday junction resolvase RuvX [Armatimonadetes bacterium]|nr:Holliday junction resolvase RuvX [Armatimonadota bacterium]
MVGRVLGLDLGERRVGLALSDPLGRIAQVLPPLAFRDTVRFLSEILDLIETNRVEKIVVGLPLNMDGTCGPSAQRALEMIERIRETCRLPVETVDERLSTKEAEKLLIYADVSRKKRKKSLDSLSAVLILQQYLDKQNRAK